MAKVDQQAAKNINGLSYVALLLVRLYQVVLSPLLGPRCRFYPSCSNYAHQAIQTHGAIYGTYLSIKRLTKCHPWHPGGLDEVPSTAMSSSPCDLGSDQS